MAPATASLEEAGAAAAGAEAGAAAAGAAVGAALGAALGVLLSVAPPPVPSAERSCGGACLLRREGATGLRPLQAAHFFAVIGLRMVQLAHSHSAVPALAAKPPAGVAKPSAGVQASAPAEGGASGGGLTAAETTGSAMRIT